MKLNLIKQAISDNNWQEIEKILILKNQPLDEPEILNYILKELELKISSKKAINLFCILRRLKKPKDFNYKLVEKYFRKRDSLLNDVAIESFLHSESKIAENILIEYIQKPKSIYAGERAVITLNSIMNNIDSFDKLIQVLPFLHKTIKKYAEYLIYIKAFDPKFNSSLEIGNYISSKKIKSTEKWSFPRMRKAKKENIRELITKKVDTILLANKNKEFASFEFYIPITKYHYNSFRITMNFPFKGLITLNLGMASLVTTYYGHQWYSNSGSRGHFQIPDIEYKDIIDEKSEIHNLIGVWMKATELYERYLKGYDHKDVNENHPEQVILGKRETIKPIELELINYALYEGDINKAKIIASDYLDQNLDTLNPNIVLYCKNLDRVTIVNKLYNIHAG